MKILLTSLLCLCWCSMSYAEIKTASVTYKQGDVTLIGYVAYDDAVQGPRPGVVVFPEWWGLTDYPKSRAVQLARLGYVAFAADLYGKGMTVDTADQGRRFVNAAQAGYCHIARPGDRGAGMP
jgi:dienelactone hydrolase